MQEFVNNSRADLFKLHSGLFSIVHEDWIPIQKPGRIFLSVAVLSVCSSLTSLSACYNIKAYVPCRLVKVNSNSGAVRDIVDVFVHTIEPHLVTCSWPTHTPGLLIFSMAAWSRISPLSCSFIGGSNYHLPRVFHLPVSPHVPNDLFAHHLLRNGKRKKIKNTFPPQISGNCMPDSPVESNRISLVYPGQDKPPQFYGKP